MVSSVKLQRTYRPVVLLVGRNLIIAIVLMYWADSIVKVAILRLYSCGAGHGGGLF